MVCFLGIMSAGSLMVERNPDKIEMESSILPWRIVRG